MRSVGSRNRSVGIAGFLVSIPAPSAPAGANYAMLSHPSYWASDASHIVPCAAGDAIRWWKDAVTGTWYEQATSGSRLIARLDATGKWYAENDGTKSHSWVDLSAFSQTNATFAAAWQFYSNVTYGMLISNCTSGPSPIRELRVSGVSGKIEITTNNNGASLIDPVAFSLNTDYRSIATLGGTTTYYRNGVSVASGADTSTSTFSTNTNVGSRSGGTFRINGRLYGLLIATSNTINVTTWDTALHNYCTA